jgi:hypothetical protein
VRHHAAELQFFDLSNQFIACRECHELRIQLRQEGVQPAWTEKWCLFFLLIRSRL